MINRKTKKYTMRPYPWNMSIEVFYEMKHGKDDIVVGTPLRFKYQRGTFKFVKMVHNSETNMTWIDCLDVKNGVFRSFYTDQLRGVIKPKRPRKRANAV